ncbi:MAG: hypothetical protein K1X53_17950 [Candidatus Sumerlaeaceae bacterium]|nr:hypothetical protein [Candidatus Sumerlaeaceae bacterium]
MFNRFARGTLQVAVALAAVLLLLLIGYCLAPILYACRWIFAAGAATLCIWVMVSKVLRSKRAKRRGWDVGHFGRDEIRYRELRGDRWEQIIIYAEMCVGKPHHVIYFGNHDYWEKNYPAWAAQRREEIVSRIKSDYHPPNYAYRDE